MRALLLVTAVALVLGAGVIAWAARPRPSPGPPLVLSTDGVERETLVRGASGRVVVFNFRTVEPDRLYRGSSFLRNPSHTGPNHAAFADGEAFDFVRSLGVRHVMDLQPDPAYFYAEEGYFKHFSRKTGYDVRVSWVPVDPAGAYGRNDRSGLRAAGEVLAIMKPRRPEEGALYVHDPNGKDAAGVAAAAYELWRGSAGTGREALWSQILRRYLASNRILAADALSAGLAGGTTGCAAGPPAFVCPEWLKAVQADLEYIAEL